MRKLLVEAVAGGVAFWLAGLILDAVTFPGWAELALGGFATVRAATAAAGLVKEVEDATGV